MAEDDEFTLSELEGRPRRRKQTKKKGLQKEVSHEAVIEYNSYGVQVGKGRNNLRSKKLSGFISRTIEYNSYGVPVGKGRNNLRSKKLSGFISSSKIEIVSRTMTPI